MGGRNIGEGIPLFVIGAKGAPMGTPIEVAFVQSRMFTKSPDIIPRKPAVAPKKMYANLRILAANPK